MRAGQARSARGSASAVFRPGCLTKPRILCNGSKEAGRKKWPLGLDMSAVIYTLRQQQPTRCPSPKEQGAPDLVEAALPSFYDVLSPVDVRRDGRAARPGGPSEPALLITHPQVLHLGVAADDRSTQPSVRRARFPGCTVFARSALCKGERSEPPTVGLELLRWMLECMPQPSTGPLRFGRGSGEKQA